MKTALITAALLVATGIQAAAQSTRLVRSGEHATYSRLVVPMSDTQPWELRTTGRRTELIVPGWEGDFDYSTVFDRIPKTRIRSLQSQTEDGNTILTMSLACSCEVKASLSGQYVVIDVVEPETNFGSFEETDQESNDDQAIAIAEARNESEPAPQDDATEVADSGNNDQNQQITPDPQEGLATSIRPKQSNRPIPNSAEAPAAKEDPADAIANRLIAQLEAAAQQGIVELQKDPEPEPEAPAPPPEAAPEPEAAGLEAEERNLDSLADFAKRFEQRLAEDEISTEDSVRVTAPKGPVAKKGGSREDVAEAKPEPEKNCLPDESLIAENWITDEPFAAQLNALRTKLIGEFDKPDPYAVRDLARFYISIGFGAEAMALLSDLEFDLEDRDILSEMAAASEGAPHVTGGVFHTATGCPGLTALWRTIIVDRGESQPVQNADRIVIDFANLPLEMRRRFGPRLVRSFLNRGQVDEARQAFDVLDRAPGLHGDGHKMMQAWILELDGQVAAAEDVYVSLYAGNAENAPEALSRLAQLYFDTGRPLPPEMLEDLEAEATKFRYEPIGAELRLAEIRARAGSRQMSDALDVVKNLIDAGDGNDMTFLAAADRILRATNAEDIGSGPYATTIFKHRALVAHPEIRADTQHHVASELLGLGLPEPALDILIRPLAEDVAGADLTAATAHMAMDNPDAAIAALKGNTEAHQMLRGEALATLGRHDEAFEAVRNAGGDASMFAWRAGEWQYAAASESEPIQSFSRFMIARELGNERAATLPGDPLPPEALSEFAASSIVEEDVTLAGATNTYEQSKQSRSLIAEALTKF